MAKQSLKTFIADTLKFMGSGVYDLFGRGNSWSSGNVLHITANQTVEAMPLVQFLTVASTDAEITNVKGAGFQQIFDTWERISYTDGNPHAQPTEETSWTMNATTKQVVCEVNSVSTVGFIGPDFYDNYEMEVVLSSTDGDDDGIGLCLGYIVENGTAHMLMVSRQGSQGFFAAGAPNQTIGEGLLEVVVNPGTLGVRVGSLIGSLRYPDGTTPVKPLSAGHGGWNTLGEIGLKVKRTPDTIQIWTTDKDGLGTYKPENSLTIDLSGNDLLAKFRQPCRIGYVANSQAKSTWRVLSQPDFYDTIYDARDGSMQVYENGAWKTYAAGSDYVLGKLPAGSLVSSISNQSIWHVGHNGVLRKIIGK